MELNFRSLKADEIDCRVAAVNLPENGKQGGLRLLLYKDARVDQNILDETVGPMNWQRHHSRDNANCTVSIWDTEKKQWIEKEDTGTESNTEAEKGLASDSFKRACFNWGIGRELYTAPFIWVPADKCNIDTRRTPKGEVGVCKDRFYVTMIVIEDGRIKKLVINNASKGNQVVFSMGVSPEGLGQVKPIETEKPIPVPKPVKPKLDPLWVNELTALAESAGVDMKTILEQAGVENLDELTTNGAAGLKKALQRKIMQRRGNGIQGETA